MWPDLEEWALHPRHASPDEAPLGEDELVIVVVDDDFSDEPTRPDIDVGVSRRRTEPCLVVVDWENHK